MKAEGDAPSWSPMPAVIGCATVTVILWIGFRAQEQVYTNTTTLSVLEALAIESKALFDTQANVLERSVRAWEAGPPPLDESVRTTWDAEALQFLDRNQQGAGEFGCLSLAFVTPDLRTAWL